jgi:hypothetical protein
MVVGWLTKAKILKPCSQARKRQGKKDGGGFGSRETLYI